MTSSLTAWQRRTRAVHRSVWLISAISIAWAVTSVAFLSIREGAERRVLIARKAYGGAKKATPKEPWKPLVFKMPMKKPPRKLEPGEDGFTMQMRERLKALENKGQAPADGPRSVRDAKVDDVVTKETDDARINGLYAMWYLDKEAARQKEEQENPDIQVWRTRYEGAKEKLSGAPKTSSPPAMKERKRASGYLRVPGAMDIDSMVKELERSEQQAALVGHREDAVHDEGDESADAGIADYLSAIQAKSKEEDKKNRKWLTNRVSKSPEERRQDYEDTKDRMFQITAALGAVGTAVSFGSFGVNAAFSFGLGALGGLSYLSGLSQYTDNAESPMGQVLGGRRLLSPVIVILVVTGWEKIEAKIPAVAELHLTPELVPALMGFFLYAVGKVLSGIFK